MEDSAKPTGSHTPISTNIQPPSLWSIQWKILLLAVLIATTVFGAMLWKTNAVLTEDKIAFVNDAAMKQIAPLKRLVQQRLADEKSALISFAGSRIAQRSPNSGGNFGNFDVVSLVQASGPSQWTPNWVERNPGVREDRWPAGHDQTLLKSLPYSRVRDGEMLWTRVSDRQGSPVYAMMLSVEIQPIAGKDTTAAVSSSLPETADQVLSTTTPVARAVLVGFTTSNPLAEVTEDFIGSTNAVYIVDDRGYVASHVNKSFQGALFSEDPLVRDILHGRKSGATGKFEDLDNRSVLGHYERIEHSNLFAVITTPESVLSSMIGAQRNSTLQVGVAVLLFCLAIGVALSRLIAREALKLQPLVEIPAPASLVVTEGEQKPLLEVQPPAPVGSRVLTDNLIRALTEPLHGILAHASLVRAKASDEEIENHAESISREARRMRDLVERIHDWEDQVHAEPVLDPVNVNDVINRSLKKREGELAAENIHVLRELRSVPDVQGAAERLERAFDQVIDNAFEALSGRMSKRIKIESDYSDTQVTVRITDTGVGMSRDIRDSAFEPFAKGFQSSTRTGLGLSEVAATIKMMGGTSSIESMPGEGSTFVFSFPITEVNNANFAERERTGFAQVTKPTPAPIMTEPETSVTEVAALEAPVLEPETIDAAPQAVIEAEQAPMSEEFFTPQIREELIEDEPSADDLEIMFNQPLAAPIHTAEEPASTGPLMLDELDDDDEIFANVPLSKAITKPTKVGQITQTPRAATSKKEDRDLGTPGRSAKSTKDFEVKIRKPQTKTRPRRPLERDLE